MSILHCQPVSKCSLVETAFLLLVTVATVNMLTTVLNDSPVFPEDDSDTELTDAPLLMDSPQCVLFGTFMIWFASITINLGPTFLSGNFDVLVLLILIDCLFVVEIICVYQVTRSIVLLNVQYNLIVGIKFIFRITAFVQSESY